MGGYYQFTMNHHELYPVYRFYVRLRYLAFFIGLPMSAGISYLTWCNCGRPDVTALVLFVCMAFVVIGSLLMNCFLLCQHCGKHTVTIRAEACSVVSIAWSLAPYTAHCRHCGKTMRTDLACKSNVFIKGIPVQVSEKELSALRHDTF